MKQFEVGKIYYCRSACNHNCIFAWKVYKRTAKFVWLTDKRGKDIGRRKVSIFGDIEKAYPEGQYSMAPVISADREVEDPTGEGKIDRLVEKKEQADREAYEAERQRLIAIKRREAVADYMQKGFEAMMAQ